MAEASQSSGLSSADLLAALTDSILDHAILAFDPQGLVFYWNKGAERLFGHPASAVTGRNVEAVFTPEDRLRGVPQAEMQMALACGRAEDERWHMRHDGSRFWGAGLLTKLAPPAKGFVKIVQDRTAQRQDAEQTGANEARFRALAASPRHAVFLGGSLGERVATSPNWTDYTGLSAEESLGLGWVEAICPDDRAATLAQWAAAAANGSYAVEHRIRHAASGTYRWHQTRAAPLQGLPGQPPDWVGSSTDVHDLRALQTHVVEAERQLRTLVEGVPHLLWRSCNRGRWIWASPQWIDYTGLSQDESQGRGWLDAVHPDDRPAALAAWEKAQDHGMLDVEFRVRRAADGAYVWHRTQSMPVRDEAGRIVEWLGTTTDVQDLKDHARALESEIQERKRVEERLLYMAFHDDLTGLRSRAFLMDRLVVALGAAEAGSQAGCAVLFLDLDRFKLVNDSLGHQSGDALLVQVASRLATCVRPQDTLARLGGDEFAIIVEDDQAAQTAVDTAARIIEAMRQPVMLGAREVFSSCSIGVAASAGHSVPETLLRDADTAMYFAKHTDSGGYAEFNSAMRDSAVEALELRTDLRNALARREFVLDYQPICDAQTKAIVGVEALIRWQHPTRGLVSPGYFIPVAEEIGLIKEIGRWVLQEACEQLGALRRAFPTLDLRMSLNASGEELRDQSFVTEMEETIGLLGIDPRSVQLEVTESILIRQPETAAEILRRIRQFGVRVALDDFGTGYSSLSYLDRYDINTIKIDRSFVSRLLTRPRTVAIVEAITRLAASIQLDVVAEGVEDEAELQILRDAGCRYVQGYLVGRPVSPATIATRLTRQLARAGQG